MTTGSVHVKKFEKSETHKMCCGESVKFHQQCASNCFVERTKYPIAGCCKEVCASDFLNHPCSLQMRDSSTWARALYPGRNS